MSKTLYTYQLHEESESQYTVTMLPDHFFARDHVVGGRPLLPGSVYLDLMLQVLRKKHPHVTGLRNMVWLAPIVITQPTSLVLDCSTKDICQIKIDQKLYARVRANYLLPERGEDFDAEKLKSCLPEQTAGDHIYLISKQAKFSYGPTFKILQHSWWNSNEALVTWELATELLPYLDQMLLHPVVVDGSFQAAGVSRHREESHGRSYVPCALKELTLIRKLPSKGLFHLRYQREASSADQHSFDIDIYDDSQLAAAIRGYTVRDLCGNANPCLPSAKIKLANITGESMHK